MVVRRPNSDLILVVDLGGSGLRVGVVDDVGNLTILGKRKLQLVYDNDWPGAVEFSSEMESEAKAIIAQALGNMCRSERSRIRGVVCTSMREGFVLLDSKGDVVYAAPNADYRGIVEAHELSADIGNEIYRRSGQWLTPPDGAIQAPCRLLWLARRDPERFESARTFMMLSDWVASLFSGKFVCERSSASSSALLDLATGEWCQDIIQQLEIPLSLFPEVVPSGITIGPVEAADCSKLGLDRNVAVVSGGADTQCSLLGCGVFQPGQVAVVAGTTTPIQIVIDHPCTDPMMKTWTSYHVVPDVWVVESNAGKTGFSYAWFADLVAELSGKTEPDEVYRLIDELAQQTSPGAGGLTFALDPVLMGELDAGGPEFRGAILGIQSTGKNRTTAAHFARAVMENMAAAYSANLEQLERVTGYSIDSVMMCGGSTRSQAQVQIVADSTGRRISIPRQAETTMLGAGISASVVCGMHDSLKQAISAMTSTKRQFKPDPGVSDCYRAQHERWRDARKLAVDMSSRIEV